MTADTPAKPHPSRTIARFPCTCGELFQGTLDGCPCLVSCPIDIYSTAHLIPVDDSAPAEERRKVHQAVAQMEILADRRFQVQVDNPLPVGRGFGTSTADIGAAISIIANSIELSMPAEAASQVAVHIEPTDSTFFCGLSMYDHRRGQFHEVLGPPPEADIIILDPGGMVDTEEFNAFDWGKTLQPFSTRHRAAYELLKSGVAAGDLAAVADAATQSAVIHQDILFNPFLEQALALARPLGALGLCRAHSGTILGLIFPPGLDCANHLQNLKRGMPEGIDFQLAKLTGGGALFTEVEPEGAESCKAC